MSDPAESVSTRRGLSTILIEFLGSMNMAITMLVVIAIAAVIGTFLQQNEFYTSYIIKFGPFWFETFKSLGLFDIYSTLWFLGLLGILLISTTICIYRNTNSIFKDMYSFRLDMQADALANLRHKDEWQSPLSGTRVIAVLSRRLQKLGYRIRTGSSEMGSVLAAMKGSSSRLGYLLTHGAIVVICVGGLIDGNLPLQLAEWRGNIVVERRDISIDLVPPESVLQADSGSFRGSVSIPEGGSADFVFLGMRDGYLVQKLPFAVEVVDFHMEHYPSGMPKLFESTLKIHDDELEEPLQSTIRVNQPLIYKGYAIYQASFADGGSEIELREWRLDDVDAAARTIKSNIGNTLPLATSYGTLDLELNDFRRFNIFPLPEDDPSGKQYRNYGPSVTFKLRAENGEAREYVNYLSPLMIDDRPFYISGMRASVTEEYRFLHIPADTTGGIERFMRFLARVNDEDMVAAAARRQAARGPDTDGESGTDPDFAQVVQELVRLFVRNGFDAIVAKTTELVPPEQQENVFDSYSKLIRLVLGDLYLELLRDEGVDVSSDLSDVYTLFFDDALNTISSLSPYGSPVYLELSDFQQIEASGLQIARAPGKNIVYLGCAMLILGVFFVFYRHHRRLWLRVREIDGGAKILFAGVGHRERVDFDREFEFLCMDLRHLSMESESEE